MRVSWLSYLGHRLEILIVASAFSYVFGSDLVLVEVQGVVLAHHEHVLPAPVFVPVLLKEWGGFIGTGSAASDC